MRRQRHRLFYLLRTEVGNYRMAPVDQFGNATQTWDHLQNVNLQIAKLAPTLRLNSMKSIISECP